ncbi:hypothetical protein BH11PAT2_BH11PAT2_08060 [soil metagenome]
MEGVSFNEEPLPTSHSYAPSRSVGFAERMVTWGFVKTSRQGEIVLLVIAGIAIVVAGFVYFSANAKAPKPETPYSKNWPR